MDIKKIMVIGAGQMGSGIAQVAAAAGYDVVMNDINEDFVNRGLSNINRNLDRALEKGRLTADQTAEIKGRIKTTISLQDAGDRDLVIEAAVENMAVKARIFGELDEICPAHAILATNTSSLPITELAAHTKRPEKVIGMHFFNPVPAMRLVEVIRGMATSDNTMTLVLQVVQALGKTAVAVQDYPGFVSNRLLMPMINEAAYALMEGVATRDSIDTVMKLGMNHPMGPLELADLIGLDVCLYIMRVLQEGFGDDKYRPCPLLVNMVAAGRLGRKVGRGFYDYQD